MKGQTSIPPETSITRMSGQLFCTNCIGRDFVTKNKMITHCVEPICLCRFLPGSLAELVAAGEVHHQDGGSRRHELAEASAAGGAADAVGPVTRTDRLRVFLRRAPRRAERMRRV